MTELVERDADEQPERGRDPDDPRGRAGTEDREIEPDARERLDEPGVELDLSAGPDQLGEDREEH
ncbi:hypothetical protein [Halorubrum sp. Atlit-26R]|uniref:hypothetical protein n=1 Tax=Halorubrum sp. Atlit-26R TaxID=2282128 RepID=UPI001F1C7AAB|nr:hypothetical protein [Halorubrum sp. Atlit-26R]